MTTIVRDTTEPPVAPHPRIRARRIEVRRDEGRRRRYRLIALVVVLALVAGAAALSRSSLVAVEHVRVRGQAQTSTRAIEQAALIHRGQPLIDFQSGTAADRIRALPWIRTAHVTREWPRTVRIVVTERRAVAQLRVTTGWALIDRTGRVLAVETHQRADVAVIAGFAAGPPGSTIAAAADPAIRLAAVVPPALVPQVASVSVRHDELSMVLDQDSIQVRFGPPTQLVAKVQALAAVLASASPTPTIRTIDVLVPSAPVLTRSGRS